MNNRVKRVRPVKLSSLHKGYRPLAKAALEHGFELRKGAKHYVLEDNQGNSFVMSYGKSVKQLLIDALERQLREVGVSV